jgi:glycosyltransferase involved in cell wall biosynthesis
VKLAVTGFVEPDAGSVAAANALLINGLLDLGHEITFFSKPSFVDPRPLFAHRDNFAFLAVENRITDRLRAAGERLPGMGIPLRALDAARYNRLLCGAMAATHRHRKFDATLWLGDYARGRIPGVPSVSFAQGPPGTDARSVLSHWKDIRRLAGPLEAWKWRALAMLRLSPLGNPPFAASDRIIIGSQQSARTLQYLYGIEPSKICVLPYPLDTSIFRPQSVPETPLPDGVPLRALWLGRIVPRKRLDLYLEAAALAARNPVHCVIAGTSTMIGGYDSLIDSFRERVRIERLAHIPRQDVPSLFARCHVLAQPSEEENFGSSVAEAQACGLPVIVGPTNGNADYLGPHDICMEDATPEALARACARIAKRAADPAASHAFAKHAFDPARLSAQLADFLAMKPKAGLPHP